MRRLLTRSVHVLPLVWLACAGTAGAATPQRIVSLAPSVTEVLFAVGLGPRVVGVTSYCRFPPAVLALPKVGGYLTPSYETLVALHPDLVVTLPEHADVEPRIAALHIAQLRVDHRSIDGVLRSMTSLGRYGGVEAEASRAVAALRGELNGTERLSAGRVRPAVLLVLGRSADDFRRLYAAGPGSFHDDLISYSGGRNVLTSGAVAYPALSAEGVLRLDPDVIVELAGGKSDAPTLRKEWNALPSLRAVRTGRVFVFTDEFLSVPGPRLVRFTATLARLLFPTPREEARR